MTRLALGAKWVSRGASGLNMSTASAAVGAAVAEGFGTKQLIERESAESDIAVAEELAAGVEFRPLASWMGFTWKVLGFDVIQFSVSSNGRGIASWANDARFFWPEDYNLRR